MGLFDNLFLDQNTPVTINDGVDHSKDAVATPQPTGGAGSGKKDDSNPPQDDGKTPPKGDQKDGFTELFQKPEEKLPAKTAEPEKDIALEIGLGSTPSDVSMGSSDTSTLGAENTSNIPSFDIGGDLGFDIGGDIGPVTTTETPPGMSIDSTIDGIKTSSEDDLSQTPVTLNASESFVSIEGVPPTPAEISMLSGAPEVTSSEEILPPSDTSEPANPVDNALFSILNEDTSSPVPVGETSSSDIPTDTQSNGASDTQASPILETTEAPMSSIFLSEEPIISEASHDDESIKIEENKSPEAKVSEPILEGSEEVLSALYPDTKTTTHTLVPSSAGKLKDTLEKFIAELESLEIEDEKGRSRRAEQIMIYRARIDEIRAESDARVRALEYEIQDLERQTGAMETEKNRIKGVINSFKKELDGAI